MKTAIIGVALWCWVCTAAFAACPNGGHQVTNLYSAGNATCFWFQVDGTNWFSVPLSDTDHDIEWGIVQEAHTTQTCNFAYTQSSTNACNQPRAVGISIVGP